MEITPHVGLTLPTQNEYYDVNVVNENNKKIDGAIGKMATNERLSTELAKKADKSTTYTKSETDLNRTYTLTHSKSEAVHTLAGIPTTTNGIYQCQFIATADFAEGDTFSDGYIAKPNGEETILPDKAFVSGDIVSVTVDVGGKKLGFKLGGGSYGTLSPQIKQFVAKAGNHEITLSWTNPSDSNFAGLYLVRKQGSMPTKLSDGIKIDVEMATTYTDNEPENDKLYYYRAFPYNAKKQVQTELTGAVVSATPTEEKIEYVGEISPLSQARYYLAATKIGNHCLFGGGIIDSSAFNVVDSYNEALIKGTAPSLSLSRYSLAATFTSKHALFGGGYSSSECSVVDAYNATLSRITAPQMSQYRHLLTATNIGDFALFCGGRPLTNVVDAYSTTLAHTISSPLAVASEFLASASNSNYALIGGGNNNNYSPSQLNTVNAYNATLVRTTAPDLSVKRYRLSAAKAGNHVLFGGGQHGEGRTAVVDAYDSQLVRTILPDLFASSSEGTATSAKGFAIFGGGTDGSATGSKIVTSYNSKLVRKQENDLVVSTSMLSATSVGDHALFGGGGSNSKVTAYKIYG